MRVYIIIADSPGQGAKNQRVYLSKFLAERECEKLNEKSQAERLRQAKKHRDHVKKVTGRAHPMSLKQLAQSHFADVAPQYSIDEQEVQLLADEILA